MPRIDPRVDRHVLDHLRRTLWTVLDHHEWRPPAHVPDDDPELAAEWVEGLRAEHTEDLIAVRALLAVSGLGIRPLDLSESHAEAAIRGFSTIRLHLRATALRRLRDSELENGEVDPRRLHREERQLFLLYLFLGLLQEHLVEALDPSAGPGA